jgi:DnaJ domain
MQTEARQQHRDVTKGKYSISWKREDGQAFSSEAQGVDSSDADIAVECSYWLEPGTVVRVEARDSSLSGECVVRHCTRRGLNFCVGFELPKKEEKPAPAAAPEADCEGDLYDILQINREADQESVHRVFRMMATRFHPDNPETGDVEKFLRLQRAYEVLSNAGRRAEYDELRQARQDEPMPIFEIKDFVNGVEAEANRRLGVLSLVYNQRRTDPEHPGISLLDLEKRMGFPREYLCFTTWYLRAKDFVTLADNSDYAITALGTDFVEANAARSDLLSNLLLSGGTGARPASRLMAGKKGRPTAVGRQFLLEASTLPPQTVPGPNCLPC